MSDGTNTYSYKYDDNGIRTEKTINGTTTYYTTVDGRITGQYDGTNTIYFRYDSNNSLIGFNLNGTEYIYLKNIQGDIEGILDLNGDLVVQYTYDAWGKLLSVTGSLADTIGEINPMRYRGYYYDNETGYYYLQSRYYNPDICRFINADEACLIVLNIKNHGGVNLFVYCNNDPINSIDPTGQEAVLGTLGAFFGVLYSALSATLIVVIGLVITVISVYAIIKLAKLLNKYIKGKKDKALAASLATLASFTTAASPPPPNNPKFKGTKTKGSVKLYEKGKVRVEVENMGKNTGDVHLQIKGDPNKYYYNPKDMQFYTNKSHTKLAAKSIQGYLNDKKIVDAITKGLTKYLGY